MSTKILTEKHLIRNKTSSFKKIDALSFISKNLYNSINYIIRQYYFQNERKLINWKHLYKEFKLLEVHRELPIKVSARVLFQIWEAWKAYFAALRAYYLDPSLFLSRPKPPKYKEKDGRNILIYPLQAISRINLKKRNEIKLSMCDICFSTKINPKDLKEVHIVPRTNHYEIMAIYEKESIINDLNYNLYSGIDLGVNNLVALTSNKLGFQPILINGRPLKSINQFYNKTISNLQTLLSKDQHTSKQIQSLWLRRKNKINNYLHKASKRVIEILVNNKVGNLIIGYNAFWKQKQNHGKKNNQSFQFIPFKQFINMLKYKAELQGIKIIINEENYTSKCSFFDKEEVCFHKEYKGKRIKRGLFKTFSGQAINADINGSYNILQKVIPNAFGERNRGIAVMPLKLKISKK